MGCPRRAPRDPPRRRSATFGRAGLSAFRKALSLQRKQFESFRAAQAGSFRTEPEQELKETTRKGEAVS